jgi:hypothetical protein
VTAVGLFFILLPLLLGLLLFGVRLGAAMNLAAFAVVLAVQRERAALDRADLDHSRHCEGRPPPAGRALGTFRGRESCEAAAGPEPTADGGGGTPTVL